MGHAFITRSSFHQLLAPPPSLPTAEPSVPKVPVTGDNMSPRWGAGGKPHARRSSSDYLIRLFGSGSERGERYKVALITHLFNAKGKEVQTERREEREEWGLRHGRSVNTTDKWEEKGGEGREGDKRRRRRTRNRQTEQMKERKKEKGTRPNEKRLLFHLTRTKAVMESTVEWMSTTFYCTDRATCYKNQLLTWSVTHHMIQGNLLFISGAKKSPKSSVIFVLTRCTWLKKTSVERNFFNVKSCI